MGRRALVVLGLVFMTVLLASCGQSYQLMSITVTPGALDAAGNASIALDGVGAFQQLTVTAKYSNQKTQDVTLLSSYQVGASAMGEKIAPLESLTVNKSGQVNLVNYACTWDTEPTNAAATNWSYYTAPYTVTVKYTDNGHTATALLNVSAANLVYCYDGLSPSTTPPAGFPGNLAVGY